MPFYAGWGLTQDEQAPPERRGRARLEQLVHAALVGYPRYRDAERGRLCEVEAVLAHLALQRRMQGRFPREVHAVGFSAWKRRAIRQFLSGSRVHFSRSTRGVPEGAAVAIWGDRGGTLPAAKTLIRVEDGFLRSIGLGADMERPLSLALDPIGIYYDPRQPSALERILAKHPFDAALLERAAQLRRRIVGAKLTKYNLAGQPWTRPDTAKRVLLVPGQVEQDASVRCGSPRIKTNLGLLRAVRAACPEAHIVYKPHPDVVAGLRDPGGDEALARLESDEVVAEGSVIAMLDQVDEIHTLTSLTGFEALIRERPVTCYGQPFYSGWGLTTDRLPVERRGRPLSIDALTAGCLILYPTYVSRATGRFITPEEAVDALVAWRETSTGTPLLRRQALRLERWILSKLRRRP
jgi:capsular polysaccharide export protein